MNDLLQQKAEKISEIITKIENGQLNREDLYQFNTLNNQITRGYRAQMEELYQDISEETRRTVETANERRIDGAIIRNRFAPGYQGNDPYGVAFVEAPQFKGAPKPESEPRKRNFIKYEDLDKYKEAMKGNDESYEISNQFITPYIEDKINTATLKNGLNKELDRLAEKGISITRTNPNPQPQPEPEQFTVEEQLQKNIEKYVDARNAIDELIRNAKDYVGYRQAYVDTMNQLRSELEEIKRELNPEGLIDSPNLKRAEEAYNAQTRREQFRREFEDRNSDGNETSYENMSLEELEELLNNKKEKMANLWNTVVSAGDGATEEEQQKLAELDAEIKKIEEEIAKRKARANDNNGNNGGDNNGNNDTSYENMSLEELEELLNNKKEKMANLWNTVVSAGDGATEEEQQKLAELDAEIKKIEEEIAKRKARNNGNNNNSDNNNGNNGSGNNDDSNEEDKDKDKGNSDGGNNNGGNNGSDNNGDSNEEDKDNDQSKGGPNNDDQSKGRPDNDDQSKGRPDNDDQSKGRPDNDDQSKGRPDNDDQSKGRPDNDDQSKGRPAPTQEWRVEKRSVWQWVKDNKKQILIIAGLSAIAVATIVALQGLMPAITAAIEANNVSTLCQSMLTNAANWNAAIASEKIALHGGNTALAAMIETMTGNKAVFDAASGIWSFGQSGMELGAFAKEAALAAAKAAKKVTTLSRTAGLLGIGGLGSIGTGVLLQNRSTAYKAYIEVMKGYKEYVKQGNISNDFDDNLDRFANEIMNDDRLSKEEKQKLLRKLSRIADKADKINKNSTPKSNDDQMTKKQNNEQDVPATKDEYTEYKNKIQNSWNLVEEGYFKEFYASMDLLVEAIENDANLTNEQKQNLKNTIGSYQSSAIALDPAQQAKEGGHNR